MVLHALAEAVLAHALLREPLQIQIGHDELGLVVEPFRFGDQFPVLVHHRMPVPGEVRGRFAGPGGGVEIGGKATRRLVRDQTMTVLVFCNRDVRCGEIQDHGCPGQSSARRRGNGHPEILTDLHKKRKLRLCNALKQKMLSERNLLLA